MEEFLLIKNLEGQQPARCARRQWIDVHAEKRDVLIAVKLLSRNLYYFYVANKLHSTFFYSVALLKIHGRKHGHTATFTFVFTAVYMKP